MPLYEYQCDSCGHRFEVIQKYSDPLVAVCPKCGGPVQKLFSSPAIQFKGSGFYITDYARSGQTDSGGSKAAKGEKAEKAEKADKNEGSSSGDSKTSTSSEGSSSTTSDSKPAASTTPPTTKSEKSD